MKFCNRDAYRNYCYVLCQKNVGFYFNSSWNGSTNSCISCTNTFKFEIMFDDTYKTVQHESEGYYREKGSKFIAKLFPVESEAEIKNKLSDLRKQYHDARHHCYAYILGADKLTYRINDDGEPSGTAGRPIYGQLLSNDITNVLVVVIRYFGGTKLGVSGLINAYKTATKDAIERNIIIEKFIQEKYQIHFPHEAMNQVMRILKRDSVEILNHEFQDSNIITFQVRKSEADEIISQLKKIDNLSVKF